MLFSRIILDIAPDRLDVLETNPLLYVLAAVAIGLLIFAVVFTVVRRKKAKAKALEQNQAEQKNKEPGK